MLQVNICPNCFVEGFAGRCTSCGYVALSEAGSHLVLPPGSLLQNRYLIGRPLGAGGFGVTYLVKDTQSGALCAIKEYLPSMLAVRNATNFSVHPSSADNEDTFQHGLKIFRREAQTLRTFAGNPSIVQVYDYFEAKGTAYFVMEYLDGVTLKALMRSMGGKVPLGLATEVLRNIATILDGVHSQGLLHRDVSPENIFVTKDGHTKLIDFGATRFFVGERSQSLSVILKPGFAPPEQYSTRGNQGPWTDLYALCATFYNVVSGQSLPDAPERLAGTDAPPLTMMVPDIPPRLAAAVERGLVLDYRVRAQTMGEFLAALGGAGGPTKTPSGSLAAPAPVDMADPAKLKGTPYVQAVRGGRPGDKWIIPKNMNMSIGRSAEQCNIVIDLPNVSRVHCTIRFDHKSGVFYLTDHSTNGTLVEAGRVEKGQTATLAPGEHFYITTKDNAMKVGLE